jgi:thiamine-phosphate pyrophosphorylase
VSRFINSSVLRLLDANANRAREALRVLEDYARFVRNDTALTHELKVLRHDLTAALGPFLTNAIVHRDTPGDVGTTIATTAEVNRAGMTQVVIAAGKRLGEALRSIEEYLKTVDPTAAGFVEQIRYRFYATEQRVVQSLPRPTMLAMERVRLYVLITQSQCRLPWLDAARAAITGGADCLQLREKELEDSELLHRTRALVTLCREHDVVSIINDRPDIAALADADGVHVGQDDLPVPAVRKLLGGEKIIGISTHSIEQARQAVTDGADYIGVGPVFPSGTKPRDFLPGLAYARQVAAEIDIPTVAIAGITLENLDAVIATGLNAVAVTAAVVGQTDVQAAATRFSTRLRQQHAQDAADVQAGHSHR